MRRRPSSAVLWAATTRPGLRQRHGSGHCWWYPSVLSPRGRSSPHRRADQHAPTANRNLPRHIWTNSGPSRRRGSPVQRLLADGRGPVTRSSTTAARWRSTWARGTVLEGGDHSFTRWDDCLDDILDFAQAARRSGFGPSLASGAGTRGFNRMPNTTTRAPTCGLTSSALLATKRRCSRTNTCLIWPAAPVRWRAIRRCGSASGKWWPATLPRRCCRWAAPGRRRRARRAALRGRGRRAAALRRGPASTRCCSASAVHVPHRARPRRGADGPAPVAGWCSRCGAAHESVPLISHACDCIARVLPQPRVQRPRCSASATPDRSELLLQAGFRRGRHRRFIDCIAFPRPRGVLAGFLSLAGGAAEAIGGGSIELRAKLADEVGRELAACRSANGFYTDSLKGADRLGAWCRPAGPSRSIGLKRAIQ